MKKTIGVTGSRRGISLHQQEALRRALKYYKNRGATKFVHGDCVGADEAAAAMADLFGYEVHVRPCDIDGMRAYCPAKHQFTYPPKPPLERNKDIVKQCDVLLAFPNSEKEVQRSGTWQTIRYAKERKTPYAIIYPTGRVEREYFDV